MYISERMMFKNISVFYISLEILRGITMTDDYKLTSELEIKCRLKPPVIVKLYENSKDMIIKFYNKGVERPYMVYNSKTDMTYIDDIFMDGVIDDAFFGIPEDEDICEINPGGTSL